MTLRQQGSDGGLVLISKSTWEPPIRREHALAHLAVDHGRPVWFVERPLDIRAIFARDARRRLAAGLDGRGADAPPRRRYPAIAATWRRGSPEPSCVVT
jgi:hypothetical protein